MANREPTPSCCRPAIIQQPDKRVALEQILRFTVLNGGKQYFRSQIGHFASDALSSDLNLRTSTHGQMKAELELFPAVSIVPGVFVVVQSYEIKPFPIYALDLVHNF